MSGISGTDCVTGVAPNVFVTAGKKRNVVGRFLKLINQDHRPGENVLGLYFYCTDDKTMGEQQIERREAQSAHQGTREIISGKGWVSKELEGELKNAGRPSFNLRVGLYDHRES